MSATVQPNAFTAKATGKVVQVLGNVVDVEFSAETLPNINDALQVHVGSGDASVKGVAAADGIELGGTAMQARDLVLEVQGELGNNQVRCLAMGSTDGLVRGATVINSGAAIQVPVGEGTLGRIFNVLGKAIDSDAPVTAAAYWPTLSADASFSRQRLSETTPTGALFNSIGNIRLPGGGGISIPNPYNQYQLSAAASWEIDLFGRIRRAVEAADRLARMDGAPAPRIGVCGLNPHAGEAGIIGREEIEVIDPILSSLRPRYPGLSSAQPGDTLFGRHLRGEFDVVLALYHDQGLAPLKTLEFDEAVNVTLGLPFVRTSPDHGTAFGIAGKGKADARSFGNAVDVARRLAGK